MDVILMVAIGVLVVLAADLGWTWQQAIGGTPSRDRGLQRQFALALTQAALGDMATRTLAAALAVTSLPLPPRFSLHA
jgi:hypothetical protein